MELLCLHFSKHLHSYASTTVVAFYKSNKETNVSSCVRWRCALFITRGFMAKGWWCFSDNDTITQHNIPQPPPRNQKVLFMLDYSYIALISLPLCLDVLQLGVDISKESNNRNDRSQCHNVLNQSVLFTKHTYCPCISRVFVGIEMNGYWPLSQCLQKERKKEDCRDMCDSDWVFSLYDRYRKIEVNTGKW